MKFNDLDTGDMFNTKPARWVKINDYEAICVMSGIHPVGLVRTFKDSSQDLIVLYSLKKELYE